MVDVVLEEESILLPSSFYVLSFLCMSNNIDLNSNNGKNRASHGLNYVFGQKKMFQRKNAQIKGGSCIFIIGCYLCLCKIFIKPFKIYIYIYIVYEIRNSTQYLRLK
jgi:hypothetical protein